MKVVVALLKRGAPQPLPNDNSDEESIEEMAQMVLQDTRSSDPYKEQLQTIIQLIEDVYV